MTLNPDFSKQVYEVFFSKKSSNVSRFEIFFNAFQYLNLTLKNI